MDKNISSHTNMKITSRKYPSISLSFILKEIADFKGWELIFKIIILGFISWAAYALYIVYLFHHDPSFANVPKFSIYDFKLSILPTLIFFLYKKLCLSLFFNWIKNGLDSAKFPNEEDRNLNATKSSVWLGSIIYYTFTSCLAYILFHDSWFFPTSLGGSAECADIYKYTPHVPHIPGAVFFYQMQFGWHFHTLIDHVVYKWREPKFWEMFLHHAVAVFLIFFSYLSNQVAVGILVLVTHDPCDVGLYGSRFYNDMKSKNYPLLYGIYVSFVASWIYFRLFVFPKCVVGQAFISLWDYPKDMMYPVYLYMILMMSALVVLHLYWFVFILRIIIGVIEGKKEYNLYDSSRRKAT